MKLSTTQLEIAREDLQKALEFEVADWLYSDISDALENENVLYNLYADYYDSSLSYLGVRSLENIISLQLEEEMVECEECGNIGFIDAITQDFSCSNCS
jgi:NAD-dependent SIR2 family protein deacetylase